MTKQTETGQGLRHPRISISVDKGVGEKFSLQADRSGRTLYAFANDWLATASKISAQGGTADRALGEWNISSVFRDIEVIPLPAEFVEEIVEKLCEADKTNALRTFAALGEKLVSLLKIYAPDIEQLSQLARGLAGVTPLKMLDIERVDGDSIVFSAVGAGRKYEVTECAFEFARAILVGYGYSITAHELGLGTIRIEAKRRGQVFERIVPLKA